MSLPPPPPPGKPSRLPMVVAILASLVAVAAIAVAVTLVLMGGDEAAQPSDPPDATTAPEPSEVGSTSVTTTSSVPTTTIDAEGAELADTEAASAQLSDMKERFATTVSVALTQSGIERAKSDAEAQGAVLPCDEFAEYWSRFVSARNTFEGILAGSVTEADVDEVISATNEIRRNTEFDTVRELARDVNADAVSFRREIGQVRGQAISTVNAWIVARNCGF